MEITENTYTELYGYNEIVNDWIDNDISPEERRGLDDTENNSGEDDDERLTKASLDNEDEDGELLNEKSFGEDYSGGDLDIPGNDDKDYDDQMGEEDDDIDDDDE